MKKLLIYLYLAFCIMASGCVHIGTCGMCNEWRPYAKIQELLAELEPPQLASWKSLVAASPLPKDIPSKYVQFSSIYQRGFRQGYAFYAAGIGKFLHSSAYGEPNDPEDAFVHGWYDGQLEAEMAWFKSMLEDGEACNSYRCHFPRFQHH